MEALHKAKRFENEETQIPTSMNTIAKLRKKIQNLEVSLAKERSEGGLLDSLNAISNDNIAAQTLMTFLHFIFHRKPQIDQAQLEYLQELFEE